MAKPKSARRTLDSYTVKHISETISPGDCVLMRSDSAKESYVARVENIESDSRGANVRVSVRWYYRPEESIGGRRQFHGSKELFLSDHFDNQSADTIEGKCKVHSFKNYVKLDAVGIEDFFCRFEYNSTTGAFNPDRVAVYCKCEMPYNPDDLMVQCDGCSDWFHPTCIDMTPEEAKVLEHFYCHNCSPEEQEKINTSHGSTGQADVKLNQDNVLLLYLAKRFLAYVLMFSGVRCPKHNLLLQEYSVDVLGKMPCFFLRLSTPRSKLFGK